MFCCVLSALFAGKLAAAARLLAARPLTIAGLALAGLAAGTAAHAGHYSDRAEANGRSLVEEILASPLCGGAVERKTT